ncbi:MAG: AAA family ATPase [Patescibacteria group bacterium]|nr:AAA family ATPase [Patescibacteria group bacterium]MDE1965803.1 AAA family ATPase [Patescibacteria group bacterium]
MTQADALSILKTGANVFLTGEPGSGKTHTVNAYIAWLRSCGIEPAVTAATGIAATHVGGATIHSWSGIGIKEYLSPADVDAIASKEHVARRIRKAKVLIIEEVSMLSAATFGMADAVCREVHQRDAPFGGMQVILVGDFFQLPPVSRGKEVLFCYASPVWRELSPLVCYLEEQYRQEDGAFLGVLSAIRANAVEDEHYETLAERRTDADAIPENVPKLFSHNADVDRINAAELAKLPGFAMRFLMKSAGGASSVEGLIRGCLSPETLELKKGAAVMFTKNDPAGRFVNGTLGVVVDFAKADNTPVVETRDGKRVYVEPADWKLETDGKVRASITQHPLRLAWAMTVHKSQGQSLDAAVIDLSRAFEYGQGYVALSRVRTLSGLYLLGLNNRALSVHPEIIEKDADFRASSRAAAAAFTDMPRDELQDMQKRFVKAAGGAWMDEEQGSDAGSRHESRGGFAAAGFMPGRLAETLEAVRDARTLSEAADARGLAVSTIVHHLEELSALGVLAKKDYEHLLPEDEALEEIRAALAESEDEKLAPVFRALGGRHSFEVIRLARLAK